MRALLLSSLVALGCSTAKEAAAEPPAAAAPAAKPAPRPGPDSVKPGAPTTLEAQVEGGKARLALRFAGGGERVSVSVRGLDGVSVLGSGEWLAGERVTPGEVRERLVAFAASGRGHLVVSVEGVFAGAFKARVHTVAVGEGPVQDLGEVQRTSDGDTVKVMP